MSEPLLRVVRERRLRVMRSCGRWERGGKEQRLRVVKSQLCVGEKPQLYMSREQQLRGDELRLCVAREHP